MAPRDLRSCLLAWRSACAAPAVPKSWPRSLHVPLQVEEYLGKFITSMERMFKEHKKAAGHENATLTIY